MNFRRFFIVAGSFLSFSVFAGGSEAPPKKEMKFFIEMAMGQQGVHAQTDSTPVSGDDFIPFDRKDIMERVALGYSLIRFLSVEAGMTFFSGYAYQIASSNNNINRSLISFEILLQPTFTYNRVHFYVMGGPALVYSGVGKFQVGAGQYTTDSQTEIGANWPNAYFFRPEAGVGVSVDATPQIRMGAVFSRIFGVGAFNATVQSSQLQVDRGYLPDIDYLAANIIFVF